MYFTRKSGSLLPQDDWKEGYSDGYGGAKRYYPCCGNPGNVQRYEDGYIAGGFDYVNGSPDVLEELYMPLVRQYDPELERLLDEEEAIERKRISSV